MIFELALFTSLSCRGWSVAYDETIPFDEVRSRIRPRQSTTPHGPKKAQIFEDEDKEIEELRGIYSLRLAAYHKSSPNVIKKEVSQKPKTAFTTHFHNNNHRECDVKQHSKATDGHENKCHKCNRR